MDNEYVTKGLHPSIAVLGHKSPAAALDGLIVGINKEVEFVMLTLLSLEDSSRRVQPCLVESLMPPHNGPKNAASRDDSIRFSLFRIERVERLL